MKRLNPETNKPADKFNLSFDTEKQIVTNKQLITRQSEDWPYLVDEVVLTWLEMEPNSSAAIYVFNPKVETISYHRFYYDKEFGVGMFSGTTVGSNPAEIQCYLIK